MIRRPQPLVHGQRLLEQIFGSGMVPALEQIKCEILQAVGKLRMIARVRAAVGVDRPTCELDRLLHSDGRPFLTGDWLSTADILWSLAVLRIDECGYPFRRNFPALFDWYQRVSRRPAFQEGVLSRHKTLSTVFKMKAAVENLLGVGLARASRSA